ncbi:MULTISPECIES: non-homologous end joining protein Ku [unclassified Inquilinus]|uniref:non-homologous end joining protein Ku n=1 Tax=unclassified Inquilinus TaxID=2645927 RepID=UPI003F939535
MAGRSFWSGYLKLTLVTCPVQMTPAVTQAERVRFHTLNAATGNRVVSRYVDGVSGKAVAEADQIRGYPVGEDEFVMLEDDELDAVALETTRTIDIETFVPRDSVGLLWRDRPHYLAPSEPVGEEAFSVIREAMVATRTVGLSKLVLYRRERPIMIEPRGLGMVVWTLRQADEVRDEDTYFRGIKPVAPSKEAMTLALSVIKERQTDWSEELLGDRVQASLKKIIARKKKGQKVVASKPAPAETGKVIDLMAALRKSLEADKKKR